MIAAAIGFVVGILFASGWTMFAFYGKWLDLHEENRHIRAVAEYLGAPTHPPSTPAGIIEMIDAHRPIGVTRKAWFCSCVEAMASTVEDMKR